MTANGETSVQFKPTAAAGGTDNVIGIWNAYNRVKTSALNRDSNSGWTYSTSSTWRAADGSNSNRISWLDGLQQTPVKAGYQVLFQVSANDTAALVGVNLNSTSAAPNLQAGATTPVSTYFNTQIGGEENFPPQLGLNYIQAMEMYESSGTVSFYGAPYESLILDTEY
jgi:hypothetical protein